MRARRVEAKQPIVGTNISQPTLVVIAGANGSGKSTFSTKSRDERILVVDPDAIAREHGLSAIGAGRKAIAVINNQLLAVRSFSIETTLSGRTHIATIEEARLLGYRIELNYVGTVDVAINLERIRRRVESGGHDVPEADVRRRYKRSLVHATTVIASADYVMVFDNSGEEMLPIIDWENGELHRYRDTPPWAEAIADTLENQKRRP